MEGCLLKNIKAIFYVPKQWLTTIPCVEYRTYSNFSVLSNPSETSKKRKYIVFPSSGAVNITGIASFKELGPGIRDLLFAYRRNCSKKELKKISQTLRINNLTLSGIIRGRVSISNLAEVLSRNHFIRYDYNIYPGLYLKVQNLGSLLLFSSGKYSIVGVTCMNQAERLLEIVHAAMLTS